MKIMYNWIHKLRPFIEKEISKEFFMYPATENELCALEKVLEVKLPVSYKDFLRICNGSYISFLQLFSVVEVLDFAKEHGFEPWSGKLEFAPKTNQVATDEGRPLHLLVFAQMDSLNYCFDTRTIIDGEYDICVYEANNTLEETLRVYSKSFYRFILDEIKEQTDWWEMPKSWYSKSDFFEKIDAVCRMGNS